MISGTRDMHKPLILFPCICLTAVFFFLFPVLAASNTGALQSQCISVFETGTINWTTGTIRAKGVAPPPKDKKQSDTIPGEARADALRNIIELLKIIRIDARLDVGSYAADKDAIMAGIEKTARDSTIVRQVYSSDGALSLTVETTIFGGFLQLVIPETIRQIPQITPAGSAARKTAGHYTGLIIDAREIPFSPVIYPVILDEQGRELYASKFISREYAVQSGIVNYCCTMEAALASKRVGANPLVLKGLRAGEENQSAIIISMSETNRLEQAAERHQFLKECRVVIVLGQ